MSIAQAHQYADKLKNQGRAQEAMAIYQQIIKAAPKNISASIALARLLYQHGQIPQARQVLASRSNYAQDNFEYLYLLAALSCKLRKLDSALVHADRARTLKPESHQVHNLLGSIHIEANRYEDAIAAFEKSMELAADFPDAPNNLAWCYRALGETELAIKYFEKAYELDKSVTEALSGQLMLQNNSSHTPEMQEAEKRLNDSLRPEASAELHFALGKSYEDCQEYDTAYQHFVSGNSIWQSALNYSQETDDNLFDAIKSTQYKLGQPSKTTDITPIFVVGLPRSSTSLVEQVLASHSQVFGAGELNILGDLCISNGAFNYSQKNKEQIGEQYLKKISELGNGKPYLVDKMPQNFRLIGVILECLPQAKIVHCHRDPKDNCLSLFKHHFPMTEHHYAYSNEDIRHYYGLYKDLMTHWKTLAPERIIDSDYEHLIHHFEDDIRKLLDSCDLDFEESCLNFQDTKRAIRTASSDQVRRGLYKSGSGQWKNYEESLKDLFEGL